MEGSQQQQPWWEKKMDEKSVSLPVLTKHFELHNRTEGKSQKTVDWYNHTLQRFARFMNDPGKSMLISDIGETQVREFILYLQSRQRWQENPYLKHAQGNLAAISVQTYVRAIRAFFNWAYQGGLSAGQSAGETQTAESPDPGDEYPDTRRN